MKRNKGFSLVELMVAIAVLGILTVGCFTIFLSTSTYKAKKAVTEIDLALSNTRMHAVSKANAWMKIEYKNGHYVIASSYTQDVVLDGDFSISYTTTAGGGTADAKDTPFILTYDRASGAFKEIMSSVAGDGTYTPMFGGTSPVYCNGITVTKGSNSFLITLYHQTGKHVCED